MEPKFKKEDKPLDINSYLYNELFINKSPIIIKCTNDYCRSALSFCGYPNDDKYVDTARKIYKRKYYTNISNKYNF